MLGTQQTKSTQQEKPILTLPQLVLRPSEILHDYSLVVQSREASIAGRREVLNGKAKFGIFGDGKELAQVAMAKAMRKGDWRAGYYRDQTLMFALGMSNIQEFFAQIYAHYDVSAETHGGGRQMNAHYASRLLNEDGSWRNQLQRVNTSADMSPTAAQMPRLVGLGYASVLYRQLDALQQFAKFSDNGNEVAFGTIGNASCAEGHFWEAINAIGVLRAPVVMSIWDDEYGISVPNEHQLTKGNLTELLQGFQRSSDDGDGFELFTVPGWDYVQLVETYAKAAELARKQHVPAIIHVVEMTQPLGHSTSGSHERYKSEERLAWEETFDCNLKFREWIIEQQIATAGELDNIQRNAKKLVENFRTKAWKAFSLPIFRERQTVADLLTSAETGSSHAHEIATLRQELMRRKTPFQRDIVTAAQQALVMLRDEPSEARDRLAQWMQTQLADNRARIGSHLVSANSAEIAHSVPPSYSDDAPELPGFQVLNQAFDAMLGRDPRVIFFGEDVGRLGGVNQTLAGMQEKYGELRVADTGIRETTILGQAIGIALRGLRPIAEIQYLDYILYALQTLSDDLATLRWRTAGGQKAPVIVSTRGHRLEGVWHAGSPMAGILNLTRGIHLCVPRDMVRAAGMYNTLLAGDDPGIVVEVLNGYRLRERLPDNLADIRVPLGVVETLRSGSDVTVVTYGANVRVALASAELLAKVGIDIEIIDVQTLLPFDTNGDILTSLQKTNRIVFLDEDVPGGATAYMLQQVIEKQGGYHWLDSEPRTLTASEHRPAYGTDGGSFSKPTSADLFDVVYELMHEVNPARFPLFYK